MHPLTLEQPAEVRHHSAAFASFLTFARFSPLAAEISQEGQEMTYRLPERDRGNESLKQARLVMVIFDLPLQVELDEFKIGDFVVEAKLIIKYVGQ